MRRIGRMRGTRIRACFFFEGQQNAAAGGKAQLCLDAVAVLCVGICLYGGREGIVADIRKVGTTSFSARFLRENSAGQARICNFSDRFFFILTRSERERKKQIAHFWYDLSIFC